MERSIRPSFGLLMIVLLCDMAVSSFAATAADLDPDVQTGSTSIKLESDEGDTVNNGALTLYEAVDLSRTDWDLVYVLTEEFTDCGLRVEDCLGQFVLNSQDALVSPETAASLVEFVQAQDLEGAAQPIAKNDILVFTGLGSGLYLVVRNEDSTGFYPIDFLVVTVPILDEMSGEWVLEVDASPMKDVKPNLVKSLDTDGEYIDDNGDALMVGDKLEYKNVYSNEFSSEATLFIPDVLDDGLTYISSDSESELSVDDEGHTVLIRILEDVAMYTAGNVAFTVVVSENALTAGLVQNTADVLVGYHAISTNTVDDPLM